MSQTLRMDPVDVATEQDPVRRAWRIAATNRIVQQRQQAQDAAEKKRAEQSQPGRR